MTKLRILWISLIKYDILLYFIPILFILMFLKVSSNDFTDNYHSFLSILFFFSFLIQFYRKFLKLQSKRDFEKVDKIGVVTKNRWLRK